MASMSYVAGKLAAAGLQVEVDGEFILVEDPGLEFERSHDGVKGVAQFCRETLDEYKEACRALFEEDTVGPAAELPQEEPVSNFIEFLSNLLGRNAQPADDLPEQEFAPTPPIKEHASVSEQLDVARKFHSVKEIAEALEIDLQDRGGVPDPVGFIAQLKQEVAVSEQKAVVVLEVGQRFVAPKGYKIKEVRPDRTTPIFYGSIFKGRKLNNALAGSKFSLVRL